MGFNALCQWLTSLTTTNILFSRRTSTLLFLFGTI
nr:MAG TPA: STAG domain [Caudoviricetes sp.]